jgi:hypothetical protein
MYMHHEKKLGFIAHPRTASTATSHVLMKMGFEIHFGHHDMVDVLDDDWEFFCTVRNPFDVLVSWFHNQPREKPFSLWLPKFLDECHFMQGRMFFGQHACNHIIHYENLQEEFECVMDEFDLPLVEIPKRNVSARKSPSFMGHYNFRTARLVVERFHKDFINNGYHTLLRMP